MFLILNLPPTRSASCSSPRSSSRISDSPAASSGAAAANALLGVRGGGVDHRAVGQHERQRADGAVGVGDHAAAHPARVVGDHPADAGDLGARRIGAQTPAVAGQQPVGHGRAPRPGCSAGPRPVVLDPDPLPVPAHVDQDRVGLRLPVEAGATGPEDERRAELAGGRSSCRRSSACPAGRPPPWGSAGRGWRRTRSGSGPSARVRTRSSPSAAIRRERSGSGVPVATQSGARSAAGRVAIGGSRAASAGAITYSSHIREATGTCTSRGPSSAAIASRRASVSSSRPRHVARRHPVGRGHGRDVEARQIEPGTPVTCSSVREPLEDHVLLVAQDEEGDRHACRPPRSTAR